METFRAGKTPKSLEEVGQRFVEVQRAARAASSHVPLTYLTALPDKPQDGIYLFDTNVTSGAATRGAYRYDSAAATYTFLA
jgi:hypothetical protein